jgi:ATP-binding cassette subfamily B (MDR/TAP) protein 1
LFHDYLL